MPDSLADSNPLGQLCVAELYKMVCGDNDTSLNVTSPVVMVPHSAGKNLKDLLDHGARGKYIFFLTLLTIVSC